MQRNLPKIAFALVFCLFLLFLPSRIIADHLGIIFPIPSTNSSITIKSSIKSSSNFNQSTKVSISQSGNTTVNETNTNENNITSPSPTVKVTEVTPTPIKVIWATPTKSPQVTPTITPTKTPTPAVNKSVTPTKVIPSATPTSKPSITPTKTAIPTPTITNTVSLTKQQYIMQAINNYRKSIGLSTVQTSLETCSFAKVRAKEISVNFNHDGFRNRINNKQLPYITWSQVTENLAMTSNFKNVVNMWITSPGHAENMRKNTPFVCVENYGNYYAYEGMRP